MSELVFILTDFFAPSVSEQPAREPGALPRLRALELLLARARRAPLAGGWRHWLARRVGAGAGADTLSLAELVATAAARTGGGAHWLATPVHLFAGLDSVHLHPAGLLRLNEAEQQTLAREFERVFADSPWRLHALGERELLLQGPALRASGADPAAVAGEDPRAAMPAGPDAAALRRLGSEIEMWLHEHPLNLERERRGELAVTTLWLWGGSSETVASPADAAAPATAAAAAAAPLPRLYGRDTVAQLLWESRGAHAQPLPADAMDPSSALLARGARSVVLLPALPAAGIAAMLLQVEQQWLGPAVTALRARRLRQLWLLTGACAYQLRWIDLMRVWRTAAPWWQRLQ